MTRKRRGCAPEQLISDLEQLKPAVRKRAALMG
jgi:hypothetical protein